MHLELCIPVMLKSFHTHRKTWHNDHLQSCDLGKDLPDQGSVWIISKLLDLLQYTTNSCLLDLTNSVLTLSSNASDSLKLLAAHIPKQKTITQLRRGSQKYHSHSIFKQRYKLMLIEIQLNNNKTMTSSFGIPCNGGVCQAKKK